METTKKEEHVAGVEVDVVMVEIGEGKEAVLGLHKSCCLPFEEFSFDFGVDDVQNEAGLRKLLRGRNNNSCSCHLSSASRTRWHVKRFLIWNQ